MLKRLILFPGLFLSCILSAAGQPNILWISLEDMSRDLGCYGDSYSVSPHADRLAEEGIRYTHAWSNAGMCSPARATIISGMYPPSTGAQNMRSEVVFPDFIRGFPEYLRKAGYYCSNHSKTDYNWKQPDSTWDAIDQDWQQYGWNNRESGQPFFTVINITDTHSSQLYYRGEGNWKRRYAKLDAEERHDPDKVTVPPYYPDTAEVRGDLARYYDNITYADRLVGEILRKLEEDRLDDDTIVFYFSDHGRGMPRSKGWCFQSSLRVPLIIRFPDKYRHLAPGNPGSTESRLVSFVDFAPTVLSLAGVRIPDHMQGIAFLGQQDFGEREYCFAYRDRMDERIDLIRAVWDGRYKYIRNYMPHLPWFHEQTRDYPSRQPTYLKWHELAASGELSETQSIYMAHSRPREQLFDTEADPFELNNLSASPDHQAILEEMRNVLADWQTEIVDLGFMPESQWWTRFILKGDHRSAYTIFREDPGLYPLTKVRRVADWVGWGSDYITRQINMLEDSNPVIRYWSALGILAQDEIPDEALNALKKLLDDPVLSVRVVAAQVVYREWQSPEALQVLVDGLNYNEPFVVLPAANALDHLGELARPALPDIKAFLAREIDDSKVGATLPVWLLSNTAENLE